MEYKIFWCKVNKYYTDKWLISDELKNKSGIFISTCVVTDRAKKKWIRFIKDNIIKLKDEEYIYISWCASIKKWKLEDNFFNYYPELLEYREKIKLLEEKPESINKFNIKNIPSLTTKKFLLIQWWCDNFCTFCATILKRWKHFSRNKEEIIQEILDFENNNWKEIVITGVNLWAWWADNTNNFKDSKLGELLKSILEETNIERIKISSLWPEFIDNELLEIFKNERILPHFHISIQSWSSKILNLMNRHYNREYLEKLLKKLKNLKREDNIEVSIWADIIVWFPSENEADFLDTYNLIEKWYITKTHAFPFSDHKIWEAIPASKFPNQIDNNTKKERINKILEIWEQKRLEYINRNKNKDFKILIESVKTAWDKIHFKWWTQNYIEVTEENVIIKKWEIKKNNIIIWKLY